MKFQTRRFVIRSDVQREAICALAIHAPEGTEVIFREEVKQRGLDQNGLYWLRLGEIAEQAWFNGKQYDKDCWHEYCRRYVMPDEIITKDGEIRSKFQETPDGRLTVISTTKLERRCFSEYITAVEAFGASLGVMFSARPREIKEDVPLCPDCHQGTNGIHGNKSYMRIRKLSELDMLANTIKQLAG